ncbi:MAG: zinc ABC transporter substrate-binding protein [Piscirickettsiaceae bacterium]|nr:MAG: zinc ABC transporter substrate-binding protein [Piscirickettsiaceae bacterium]
MIKQLHKTFFTLTFLLTLSQSLLANDQINLFACEPEWAAIAHELGGDRLNTYSATTSEQDPHHIQPRPSLISHARRADILACTGAELEAGWLPVLLRKAGNSKILAGQPGYFMAADHVLLLGKPSILDRSLGDVHADGNPHFHTDPYRLQQVARALTETLASVDAIHADEYRKNLSVFISRMNQAIVRWTLQAKPLLGKTVIAHHKNWLYLENWLGLEEVGMLEPKSGIPPTSMHLSKVLSQMKQTPADMIIYASHQDSHAAHWLSNKTAIPAISLPATVEQGQDIFQWIDHIVDKLTKPLS